MTANQFKRYAHLLQAIQSRKAEVEAELQEIDVALTRLTPPPETAATHVNPQGQPTRVRNTMSLGDAVFLVTKNAPLSKEAIITRVLQLGYQFGNGGGKMDEVAEALVASVLRIDKRFEESNGKYGPTLEALFPAS